MSSEPQRRSSKPDATGEFVRTRWSLVLRARQPDAAEAARALETLCRTYWYPVYAFVRRYGYAAHDAQDLTQEFFARILTRNTFAKADPERGRFRSFLVGTLRNFLADERDKSLALKRGGGAIMFSLDSLDPEARFALEPAIELSPDRIFDRRWASTVLEEALKRLRAEHKTANKARQFDLLKPFLDGDAEADGYARVAAELQTSSNAVAVAVYRLRQRFRVLVREQVAETVANPTEVDDELRSLFV